ncbi:MAG: hypothetical protein ACJA13_002409 [Paraglaciecola sp.]|jgi:hypothetical protein
MSFNEDELKKVQSMTSGVLKGKARSAIANTIREYEPKIQAAKSLAPEDGQKAFLVLTNHASKQRHIALQSGASSFNNSAWTAAATVENWLHELMGGDPQGIESVEAIIQELRARA